MSAVYQAMYTKQIEDLKITGYILEHFKLSPNGVAYYVLPDEVLKELHITTERGKENVNLFSNIEGINGWCSISEDKRWLLAHFHPEQETPINELAARWEVAVTSQVALSSTISLNLINLSLILIHYSQNKGTQKYLYFICHLNALY